MIVSTDMFSFWFWLTLLLTLLLLWRFLAWRKGLALELLPDFRPEPGRVLLGGHRGWGKLKFPAENSAPSFEKAIVAGLEWIETDILMSKDGVLFIAHGPSGELAGHPELNLEQLTIRELKELDFGAHLESDYPERERPVRVLTLAEFLQQFAGRAPINLELKRRSFRRALFSGRFEREVVREVEPYLEAGARIIFSSFNPIALIRLRYLRPLLPLGFLFESRLGATFALHLLELFTLPDFLHPRSDLIDSRLMNYARRKGYRVNAWVVNERSQYEKLKRLGVTAILTDECALALTWEK